MDPDIFTAFQQSTAVSRKLPLYILFLLINLTYFLYISEHRGIGANMLKVGNKRRRTPNQIKEDREQEMYREQDISAKL